LTITNLIQVNSRNDFKGWKCFKTFRDRDGNNFEGNGPRYVLFCDNVLVCEVSLETELMRHWRQGTSIEVSLKDYKGIDSRLK
jgi:hypothetical protein